MWYIMGMSDKRKDEEEEKEEENERRRRRRRRRGRRRKRKMKKKNKESKNKNNKNKTTRRTRRRRQYRPLWTHIVLFVCLFVFSGQCFLCSSVLLSWKSLCRPRWLWAQKLKEIQLIQLLLPPWVLELKSYATTTTWWPLAFYSEQWKLLVSPQEWNLCAHVSGVCMSLTAWKIRMQ